MTDDTRRAGIPASGPGSTRRDAIRAEFLESRLVELGDRRVLLDTLRSMRERIWSLEDALIDAWQRIQYAEENPDVPFSLHLNYIRYPLLPVLPAERSWEVVAPSSDGQGAKRGGA